MTVAALVCQRWVQRLLFEERKLAAGTVGLHVAALRIVYVRVLKRRTLNPIGSPASDPSPALAKRGPAVQSGAVRLSPSLAVSSAVALLAAGCASRVEAPRTIVLENIRARPVRQAMFVDNYEGALVSIAAITERDLGLPGLQGVLQLVPDREALYAVLEAHGADPATARGAADTMVAIGAYRAVYVNQAAFARLNWNARIAVLSHELAHTAQYEWSGGRRGTSDQWLREGFADWVQAHVLDSLGVLTGDGIRMRISRFISRPGAREQLPPLSRLTNFPEWVAVSNSRASNLLYPYAFVAADFLVQRHSLAAVIGYFRLFGHSDDRVANFKRAFGEEWSAFDAALRDYIAQLRPH